MFGKLDSEQIEQVLGSQLLGRLGCSNEGVTYVYPVSYAYDGEYVYIHSYEGFKMEIMRKNPRICFEVEEIEDLANWKTVMAWGQFEELVSEQDRALAYKKLHERRLPVLSSETVHIAHEWPFAPDKVETISGLFFRIKLDDKTGKFEKIASQEFFAT